MATIDLLSRFQAALFPYQDYWEDWTISDYCFLNKEEIGMVELLRNNFSQQVVAEKIGRSETTAKLKTNRIIRKLKYGVSIHREWLLKYKTKSDQNDFPLHVPVICLPLPTLLKHRFYTLGDTLHEVLYITEGNFMPYRGIGKTMLGELVAMLAANGIDYTDLIAGIKAEKQVIESSPPGEYVQHVVVSESDELKRATQPGGRVCRIASGCCMNKQEVGVLCD